MSYLKLKTPQPAPIGWDETLGAYRAVELVWESGGRAGVLYVEDGLAGSLFAAEVVAAVNRRRTELDKTQ